MMAFDDSIYGLTLDQWHRPGQTVVVDPTTHLSDYGVGSMPSSYLPLYTWGHHAYGSVMVAVGSTVIILGGQMGATVFLSGYMGYAKKRLIGLNGGRDWTAYDLDSPWAWPALCGAWVIGERIYVACANENSWGKYITAPGLVTQWGGGYFGDVLMYYSDDLGATWKSMETRQTCVGSDITDRLLNYDLYVQDSPAQLDADKRYGTCIHKDHFVVIHERGCRVPYTDPHNGVTWYWVQGFEIFTMPLPSLGVHGEEGRKFKCLGWFLPSALEGPAGYTNYASSGDNNFPSNMVSFDDFILVGCGTYAKQDSGLVYHTYPTRKWKMRFTDDMASCSFESLSKDNLFWSQTTFGVCSYRSQRWVYSGGIASTVLEYEIAADGGWDKCAGMTNRMLTSVDGDNWHEISYGESPPAYPAAGFQNVPVRCRHASMTFVPGTKEILIGHSYVGQCYYDDLVGPYGGSARQGAMMMAFMHSSSIPFPEEIPVETPWYNFPLGGSPGTSPDAPGESGDFSTSGDLLRCLRVDLEDGTLTAGSGYPLVSTLQNSSPTALSGQIPDKMLAGDKYGYLNKAMVPESPGMGNSSRYTLWTTVAGSTTTVLAIDVTSRPNAFLQAHFLKGLPIRIQSSIGVWVESTISDNGNDTITLASALDAAPAAGTPVLIAPMDCAALLNEIRYQYPARLVQARINIGNYQPDDQNVQIGIRTSPTRRRFGDFSVAASVIQEVRQRQLEAGGGVVGITPRASRSLTYDLRFVPNGGGDLEIGPIILTENIQPGEGGLSR